MGTTGIDGQPVRYNDTPKFLGIAYDRQLTFSRHAALVGNSLMRQTEALRKLASPSCDMTVKLSVQPTSQQGIQRWNTVHCHGCRGYQTRR